MAPLGHLFSQAMEEMESTNLDCEVDGNYEFSGLGKALLLEYRYEDHEEAMGMESISDVSDDETVIEDA